MRFSGKQPTYPSPKPTLKLNSHLRQNDGFRQGGVGGRFPSGWNSEWARWSESSAFSLATRAGDVGPLGISRVGLAGKKILSLAITKINSSLTKLFRSRWLYVGQVPFCTFIDQDFVSLLGQSSAILSSRLVNNAYIIQQSYADGRVTSNYSIVRVLFLWYPNDILQLLLLTNTSYINLYRLQTL